MQQAGWNSQKTETFKRVFFEFLKHVRINSKETGGDTVLADHIYEAQRRFLDCIWEGLSRDIHTFNFLKSRQLGISTISRALSVFWLGMHKGLQGAMVFDTQAHREESRKEIMEMINNLPRSLGFPTIRKDSRDLLILSNDSTLRFLNAGVRKSKAGGTLGRSSGLNFAHLSELCSFENEEGMVSFENALSETYPDRLIIKESTARGFGYWYRVWMKAKADTTNQMTCFIGWWAKETQSIAKDHPAYQKYGLDLPTEAEAQMIKDVEELYDHRITEEQLAWYRRKTNPLMEGEDDKDGVEDETVRQEQPSTEQESFLKSGSTFFPPDSLTKPAKETATDKFKGYQFFNGTNFLECDWGITAKKKDIQLKVWEEPDQDGLYVIACDPAYGHSEENNHSAIQILRCYADCIEQVAEYANSSIQTEPFAWVIAALCGWYKNVYMILEVNGPGEAVWNGLRDLKKLTISGQWKSLASEKGLRDIFNNVRDYMFSRSDSMNQSSQTYHWVTNAQRKVAIMERLRDYVTKGSMILRSFDVLDEMQTVVRNGDSIAAEGLNRDDRTICLAMGIKCYEERVKRVMLMAGRTRAHEIANKRMTLSDQISVFNKHRLDLFFKQKQNQRRSEAALERRSSWRSR